MQKVWSIVLDVETNVPNLKSHTGKFKTYFFTMPSTASESISPEDLNWISRLNYISYIIQAQNPFMQFCLKDSWKFIKYQSSANINRPITLQENESRLNSSHSHHWRGYKWTLEDNGCAPAKCNAPFNAIGL